MVAAGETLIMETASDQLVMLVQASSALALSIDPKSGVQQPNATDLKRPAQQHPQCKVHMGIDSHRQRHPDTSREQSSGQSSNALAYSLSGDSLKPIMDLISDRIMWYRVRNDAIKARKKLLANQDQDHYRSSDYGSSKDLLMIQRQSFTNEIQRADKYIAEIDDKVPSALRPVLRDISKAWTKEQAASEEPVASKAAPANVQNTIKQEMEALIKREMAASKQSMKELLDSQVSKLKESLARETEEKLSSLRKTLRQEEEQRISSLKKALAQENEKRVAEARGSAARESANKIAELENSLAKESSKTAALDRKVADLEARLDKTASEQRRLLESLVDKSQLAQQLQLQSGPQGEKLGKLEARLRTLEGISPAIEDLAGRMRSHSELVTERARQQDESNTRLASLESTVAGFLAKGIDSIPTEVAEIKERVQHMSSNPKPVPVAPDNRVLEVVKPELAKITNSTRDMIKHIQDKLQPFLEHERHKTETLERQFGDMTLQVSELQKESAAARTEHSALKEKLADQSQAHAEKLSWLEGNVNDRINATMGEFRTNFEGVYMQLQVLNSWQTNFNTKGLYREIMGHINATLPDGTVMQIKNLRQRLEFAETRILACENNACNKRRKLAGGNSEAVNDHQVDA
ncbi:hypothetical protein Trco_000240 [Trichoderma cornu-damae]|uniref:Uncharacterized protein n=1 Tax=Trichoderma cornu-damae TaxID=654480 RepID=A0A9P8QPX6_9HYPO|nr:hypothetical protein Trco_000240 [Trichoderma cornu-damae]